MADDSRTGQGIWPQGLAEADQRPIKAVMVRLVSDPERHDRAWNVEITRLGCDEDEAMTLLGNALLELDPGAFDE